ncbi:MAG: hypothetical protein JSW10_08005 [Pseudomonadota bacterium]|nr:MAG: hypothetical protein JSW10_08005 [Pseudomonadota bacterium]
MLSKPGVGLPEFAGLGNTIQVRVKKLDVFLNSIDTQCKDDPNCKPKDIHLFLDGMEIKGIRPQSIDREKGALRFVLVRREALPEYLDDKQQREIWAELFGFRDGWNATREVQVSIGAKDGSPLPSDARLGLVRVRMGASLATYVVVMLGVVVLYVWGWRKGVFSDRGSLEHGEPALSLARVQMGFWFFLVVAAFFFIWLVIGELPAIPGSVLALIGIASGTALGAAAIDANKRARATGEVADRDQLQAQCDSLNDTFNTKTSEADKLDAEIERLEAATPPDVALIKPKQEKRKALTEQLDKLNQECIAANARLTSVEERTKSAKDQKNAVAAKDWLTDLLSDSNGWSFHRLQMLVWTIILGVVFVQQVLSNLTMPEFDATLLALMGISSGTYLGFKFPEQQPQTPTQPAA